MSIEIEKINAAIDAMEIDTRTRARIKADVERIYNRDLAQLPDEYHDKVLQQPSAELRGRILIASPFRLDQIPDVIADFARELRAAVINERANNPALRPWSAENEVKQSVGTLNGLAWNGNEVQELRRMLKPGDVIARIGLRSVELADGTVFTRADVRRHALARRPRGVTPPDVEFLALNFTSDQELESIETAERIAAKENSVYRSGPPEIIGKPLPAASEG